MNVLVPFNAHHQFVLVNLRHTFLFQEIEEEHAKRKGGNRSHYTEFLVREHPIHTLVIETFQPIVLQHMVKATGKQTFLPKPYAVEQQVEHRQQHDTRDIRNHQPHGNGKCLIHKDGTGNAAHENQRNKHGDGSKR